MPQLGTVELVIIAFLALLFFGKDKLPEFAKSLGESLQIFKDTTSKKSDNEEKTEQNKIEL